MSEEDEDADDEDRVENIARSAPAAVEQEEVPEVSCLRFPTGLASTLSAVKQHDLLTLRDIFGARLAMTDEQLLRTPVVPEECQLRTTAFLLRRMYSLQEAAKENVEMKQLVIGVAQECTPFQYKGRRS